MTKATGVDVTLGAILGLYAILTVFSISVPMLMSRRWRRGDQAEEDDDLVPYGPSRQEAGAR